jgi:hypothetical protein
MEQSLDLLLEKDLGTINFVSFIEQSPVWNDSFPFQRWYKIPKLEMHRNFNIKKRRRREDSLRIYLEVHNYDHVLFLI